MANSFGADTRRTSSASRPRYHIPNHLLHATRYLAQAGVRRRYPQGASELPGSIHGVRIDPEYLPCARQSEDAGTAGATRYERRAVTGDAFRPSARAAVLLDRGRDSWRTRLSSVPVRTAWWPRTCWLTRGGRSTSWRRRTSRGERCAAIAEWTRRSSATCSPRSTPSLSLRP